MICGGRLDCRIRRGRWELFSVAGVKVVGSKGGIAIVTRSMEIVSSTLYLKTRIVVSFFSDFVRPSGRLS